MSGVLNDNPCMSLNHNTSKLIFIRVEIEKKGVKALLYRIIIFSKLELENSDLYIHIYKLYNGCTKYKYSL